MAATVPAVGVPGTGGIAAATDDGLTVATTAEVEPTLIDGLCMTLCEDDSSREVLRACTNGGCAIRALELADLALMACSSSDRDRIWGRNRPFVDDRAPTGPALGTIRLGSAGNF